MPQLTSKDLFKPEVLTGLVEFRAQEDTAYDIGALAPINQTRRTSVKLNVRVGTHSKLGQFRAENAETPLSAGQWPGAETFEIEIPILSEKEVVRESLLRQLNSVDDEIARDAVNEILDQGTRLRQQNINLSRFMVFRACQDILTITYANGSVDVDFGMDNDDGRLSASHLVSAGVLWTNRAIADPQANVDAWALILSNDHGVAQSDLQAWITTPALRDLQNNAKFMALAGTPDQPRRPSQDQLVEYLGIGGITVYDQIFKDLAGNPQRYLPVNKMLLFAPRSGAQPTIQLMDGPVVRYNAATQGLVTGNNPGALTELWATPDPPVQHIRVTTARMPIVIREGIISATIG